MLITEATMKALNTLWTGSFNKAFAGAQSRYSDIAMRTNSTGAAAAYGWLGQLPFIREWLGDRRMTMLTKSAFVIENRDFEMTIRVKRNDIEDDTAGIYGPLFDEMGRVAALHPDELVFGLLRDGFVNPCFDNQNFFDSAHPVEDAQGNPTVLSNMQAGTETPWFLLDTSRAVRPLIYQQRRAYKLVAITAEDSEPVFFKNEFVYGCSGRSNAGYGLWQLAFGSKLALNAENFEAAKLSMTTLRGDAGKLLGVHPTMMVVPPALEYPARRLLEKQNLIGGESNIHYKEVELIVAEWLAQ